MLGAVQRRMDNGRLSREVATLNGGDALDPLNPKEVDQYAKLGGNWFVKNLFPNSGRTGKFFSNAIKRNLVTTQGGTAKLQTWGTEDLIKEYEQLGGTGYTQESYKTASKSTGTEETLFVLTDNHRINPNLYGHYMNHYFAAPSHDYTIIASYQGAKILSQEPEDVTRNRDALVKSVTKMVGALPITGRVTVKSPRQIESGESEDNRGFTTHYESKASEEQPIRGKVNGSNKYGPVSLPH